MRKATRRLVLGWAALAVAAGGCGPAQQDVQQQSEDFERVYSIPIEGSPIRGNPSAPITIVEFADFQCPFCAATSPLIQQTLETYGDQVRIVYKHFPLSFHRAARPAAIASMAAQEQGRFWELHDVMLESYRTLSAGRLPEYAEKAGLDVERFKRDLDTRNAEYGQRVTRDYQQGLHADVRGTPTIYVNGKKLRKRSIEGINAQIEAELGESPS